MTPEEKHNHLLDSVNINYTDRVLGGEIYQLTYLFTWKRTPHGDLYWRNFRDEKLPLSKNAIAYIEMIIEEKEKKKMQINHGASHKCLIDTVKLEYAAQVLEGDRGAIAHLFVWGFTPHGAHYWYLMAAGDTPLTHNAKAYMKMIIEEKKKIV